MNMVRHTLGFMLPDVKLGDPSPLTAFGHPGMGGSLGFADPQSRLAVGYVRNKMVFGGALERYIELCCNV
jgi:CubicO group peptidase (beta-lactamase class C family)